MSNARNGMVRAYLLGLQESITGALTVLDGSPLVNDHWEKAPQEPLQGNGITRIMEGGGGVCERACHCCLAVH